MARILVVDSNPDTQRALSGLIKYRTQHTFEMVDSCTEGARKAVSMRPDLIMINALMFMASNYAFPRVVQQHDQTAVISFLVHTVRDVGELTRKQIEASGVAGMVELPISAEELNDQIVKASERSRQAPSGIQPVEWQRVEKPVEPEVHKGKTVQAVQWQSITPEEAKRNRAPKGRPATRPQKAKPKEEKKPVVFRPLEDTAKEEKPKTRRASSFETVAEDATVQKEKPEATGFQASSFETVAEDDAVKNQKPETFKAQIWDDVDPGEKVKRPRR